jgi:hypothetical protein
MGFFYVNSLWVSKIILVKCNKGREKYI